MTLSSPSLTLSSLGDGPLSSYLESVAPGLSVSIKQLTHQVSSRLGSSSTLSPSSFSSLLSSCSSFLSQPRRVTSTSATTYFSRLRDLLILSTSSSTAFTFTSALIGGLLLIIVIMSWRSPFNFWRQGSGSPYHEPPAAVPQVNDSDFSYLTTDDIVDPPGTYETNYPQRRQQPPRHVDVNDDTSPDILFLKHRNVTYPLLFSPFAIDDKALTVGEVRRLAAEKTGTSDPSRIRMLYKGKLLRDDARPCRDEGLKQESEIMCVVSEVRAGESTSERSTSDSEKKSDSGVGVDDERPSRLDNDKRKKKKKKKGGKSQREHRHSTTRPSVTGDSPNLAAPTMEQRPSSSGRSAAPSPAPNLQNFKSAHEQVDALTNYYRGTLVPLCNEYISHPPTDAKTRDYEHKKLGETILTQVMIKADEINSEGSETARNARRALIKEAQAMLNKLDQVAPTP